MCSERDEQFTVVDRHKSWYQQASHITGTSLAGQLFTASLVCDSNIRSEQILQSFISRHRFLSIYVFDGLRHTVTLFNITDRWQTVCIIHWAELIKPGWDGSQCKKCYQINNCCLLVIREPLWPHTAHQLVTDSHWPVSYTYMDAMWRDSLPKHHISVDLLFSESRHQNWMPTKISSISTILASAYVKAPVFQSSFKSIHLKAIKTNVINLLFCMFDVTELSNMSFHF